MNKREIILSVLFALALGFAGTTFLIGKRVCIWLGPCAAEYDPELTFIDYCQASLFRDQATTKTVEALLALTKSDDCENAYQSLKEMKAVELNNKNLESLAPLTGFKNLIYLSAENNEIKDIQPIASLEGLISLKLQLNRISNLEGLSSLARLRSLDLSGNPVTDLNALKDLTGLSTLRLDNTNVESITTLSGLKNLVDNDYFRGLSMVGTPLSRAGAKSNMNCPYENIESPALTKFCSH